MKKNSKQLDKYVIADAEAGGAGRTPPQIPSKFSGNFLQKMDGRCGLVKSLKANFDAIVADTGSENASHIKRSLIARFVWLEAVMASLEAKFPEASEAEAALLLSRWTQSINSMLGICKTLGIERRAKSVPSLESYVRGKAR